MSHTTPELQHSPQARGERLRQARKLARLTLKGMSGDTINFNTLSGWEAGKHGGLTEKGAKKVIERLAQEGVNCALEWLLYGIGKEPTTATLIQPSKNWHLANEFIALQKSLMTQLQPDFLGLDINDDAMTPQFCPGDYVCGRPLPLGLLSAASGQAIIAELTSGDVLLRRLLLDNANQTITLVASNAEFVEPIYHNVQIQRWAKVLCHLRNDPIYQKRELS